MADAHVADTLKHTRLSIDTILKNINVLTKMQTIANSKVNERFSYDVMYSTVGVNLYKFSQQLGQIWISNSAQTNSAHVEIGWSVIDTGHGMHPLFNRNAILRSWQWSPVWQKAKRISTTLQLFISIYNNHIKVTSKGAMMLPLVGCTNSASQSLHRVIQSRNAHRPWNICIQTQPLF